MSKEYKKARINYLGKSVAQRRWNQSAIDCYERGGVCFGCQYNDFFKEHSPGQKCQMKAAVLELVRILGRPQGVISKGVLNE